MAYVKPEIIQEARKMDLLTWMQLNEPDNLVHVSGKYYSTREHDSMRISNGKWYWFSRGIGGHTALDYLVKVKELSFPQAVEAIMGMGVTENAFYYAPVEESPKEFVIPNIETNPRNAVAYLKGRGICREVIEYCIAHSMIFESSKYHNVIFVGYDEKGIARYGAVRGTRAAYKGEVTGSNKMYSFRIIDNPDAEHLHIFEAAIDLLSYASLEVMEGRDWKKDSLLSLAGVYKSSQEGHIPLALSKYLENHGSVTTIHLHLDNDEVGRGATEGIMKTLGGKYEVLDEPPESGKDMNDTLMSKVKSRRKEDRVR